ncbi:histone-binding protein n1/n2, putative [Perkinsus marinus ATCC 50983]|uniref:Histone-binding protein n1/n2, putative n=1 Tax=Perkinsus marinus (strain ATCC 50983 / TXsc) TaxID=423536 RepID=C5LKV6_PERM5|nr:histone-binding protein n1/n2, putative [Perkinsus marinus ATCC 50983]EER02637.1 histone-binding protein n1/n2, putative [Perkinsus marinus ATCC 50983]|eukprot:XP_002769919.1 histone-binding protein n1/n2, putative [Perkinsus marinus ATCC 50983]
MDRLQEAVDMVKATREKELAGDKGAEDEYAESEVDDLQLAWENLEQCRKCLQLFSEEEMPWDLARRCHSRLGDFLQLQERYPQACEEFEKALEICEKCHPAASEARKKAAIMLRLGECQRHADKEKGKKTLLEAKALLENRAQGDDEADDVLAAINEALEDSREGERNDQVKVIQQMMSPAPATSGGTACSLEVSTSAKFDKATLGSSYKVRYRSLAI